MKWTKDEESFLKDNAGKISIDELVKQLNHSKAATKTKARSLGLPLRFLNTEWKNNDITFVKER